MYTFGMQRNLALAKQLLPEWKVVVYHREDYPWLAGYGQSPTVKNGMFWRFAAYDLKDCERMVCLDADSRINSRLVEALALWQESHQPFLAIRDHPHHTLPMMGGLWGVVKGDWMASMQKLIDSFQPSRLDGTRDAIYGTDQKFLSEVIYPIARKSGILELDSCTRNLFPGSTFFPFTLDEPRFCGEVYTAKDVPRPGDWEMRWPHAL